MGPRGALLTLSFGLTSIPFKFLQDTADASPLSGIATFGGFWTFVNGTFALFFGANVIYFMFGGWNPGFAPAFADRLERLPRSQTTFRFGGSAPIPASRTRSAMA
jgi:hypothetical protein